MLNKGIVGVAAITMVSRCGVQGALYADKPSKEEFMQKARKIQMPFIANEGQADGQVKYYAKTFGGDGVCDEGGQACLFTAGRGEEARSRNQKVGGNAG